LEFGVRGLKFEVGLEEATAWWRHLKRNVMVIPIRKRLLENGILF